MSGMCIHVDSEYVKDPSILDTVPTAPGSKSYKPIPHSVVRAELLREIEGRGLNVLDEKWALSDPRKHRRPEKESAPDPSIFTGYGARMFGLIRLKPASDAVDFAAAIAVRNSSDKSMPLGLAAGTSVFICDNMALCGDYIAYRKHTSGIDISVETRKALDELQEKLPDFCSWFDSLKNTECTDHDFDRVICDCIRNRVVTGAQPRELLSAWYERKAPEDRLDVQLRLDQGAYGWGTAWTAQNLFTDLVAKEMRPTSTTMAPAYSAFNNILKRHTMN